MNKKEIEFYMMFDKRFKNLILSTTTNSIVIDDVSYNIEKVSTFELSKYRKKLVDSALKQV